MEWANDSEGNDRKVTAWDDVIEFRKTEAERLHHCRYPVIVFFMGKAAFAKVGLMLCDTTATFYEALWGSIRVSWY